MYDFSWDPPEFCIYREKQKNEEAAKHALQLGSEAKRARRPKKEVHEAYTTFFMIDTPDATRKVIEHRH